MSNQVLGLPLRARRSVTAGGLGAGGPPPATPPWPVGLSLRSLPLISGVAVFLDRSLHTHVGKGCLAPTYLCSLPSLLYLLQNLRFRKRPRIL